jgi:hypothetical protein
MSIYEIGNLLVLTVGMIMLATGIWGAWIFRKRMRELGKILANQGSKYPDTGESGEAYDVEQKAEKDRTS